jgi:murein DD-endopeptidase
MRTHYYLSYYTKSPILLFLVISVFESFSQRSADVGSKAPQPTLAITVPGPMQVVTIDKQHVLVYELQLTNAATNAVCLEKLEVLSGSMKLLATFSADELKNRFWKISNDSHKPEVVVDKGSVAVIYLEIPLSQNVPEKISHRVYTRICEGEQSPTFVIETDKIPVSGKKIPVLSAPLSGGPWAAIHSPVWERGHRRVIYTQNGVSRIPGRFAIDFMKLDDGGKYAPGDEDSIQTWYGYGANVLAVADGTIASTKGSFAESSTLSGHPDYAPDQATGNYISLKMAEGQYVFYEHLKPGSILVKPGERVEKGQVIAQLGFTGQTTGPHLHLHVADGDSPLGAEGVPYVFEEFTQLGSYPDMAKFGNDRWENGIVDRSQRKRERPGSNTVIIFE